MKVKKIIPCGYCKGVINAINLAKQTKEQNKNTPVYILGMIVHNKHVVKELENLGIITLDTNLKTKEEWIDSINEGTIILTAHGTPAYIKEKINNKGLNLIDATCKDVLKTEEIIEKYSKMDYQILYYGIKNHPESVSATSISKNVILIENENDINKCDINRKSVFINQTTMSSIKAKEIFSCIKKQIPQIEYIDGTCNATDSRQNAIRNLNDCDVLYIIGDKASNNTNKLKDIANECNIKKVFLIDNKNEIEINDLSKDDNVYVTAGASTPPNLIDDTIEYLNTIF